jgi:hypothetical protein
VAASSPTPSPPPSVRTLALPPLTPVVVLGPQWVVGPAGAAATPSEFVTPLEDDEELLDAAHGESSMRYCTYDNIVGVEELVSGLAAHNLIEELNLMSMGSHACLQK